AAPPACAVLVLALGLGGCELANITATEFTGIAAGALAGGLSGDPFVAVGVGLAARYAMRSGIAYGHRALQGRIQGTIAQAAGPLGENEVALWAVTGGLPFRRPRGRVEVTRAFGEAIPCKEITYSIEAEEPEPPRVAEPWEWEPLPVRRNREREPARAQPPAQFFVAVICREGERWVWAVSEPSTDKWFGIQ
ncbi:MAG TPA: hypothetical protein VFG47_23510, partial [Geminicoccaceae bacterium]|nr:hypothetical protein [Geminicoccaceae bacterium]